MSQETLELVQKMDLKEINAQFALQCAPLISCLKPSNLLLVRKEEVHKMLAILGHSRFSCEKLWETREKISFLIYDREMLEAYLHTAAVRGLAKQMGYEQLKLEELFAQFRVAYQAYEAGRSGFPHEMGLLLGYPPEDIEGFIRNSGQNSLYTGYWKVYGKLSEKKRLFQCFERAKDSMIQLVSYGISMNDIMEHFYLERTKVLA